MSTNIELAKPRDFGEIISDTFQFVRQNFKPLLKYFFIFCGFFLLASTVLNVLVQVKALSFMSNINTYDFQEDKVSSVFSMLSVYLLLIFFMILTQVSINVMALCYMTIYKQKQNITPTTEEMWGYFKFYFLKIFGSSLLLSILIVLGAFFCLLPGIYLAIVFALVPPIMIVENTSFGYAFNRCFSLIKNNWWQTFGTLIVVYIIIYVCSMVVTVPSMIFGAGSVFLHIKEKTPLTLPVSIITSISQSFIHVLYILLTVAVGLCYFNLTESKEGTHMMERINQFGNTNTDTNSAPEEY